MYQSLADMHDRFSYHEEMTTIHDETIERLKTRLTATTNLSVLTIAIIVFVGSFFSGGALFLAAVIIAAYFYYTERKKVEKERGISE